MPQVTTGATLLSVDVRFPEVHELPRDEGTFRAKFVELKGMSAVRPPATRPRWKDGGGVVLCGSYLPFFRSFSSIRAFTSFLRSREGRGFSGANWMVPFAVLKFFRSFWNSFDWTRSRKNTAMIGKCRETHQHSVVLKSWNAVADNLGRLRRDNVANDRANPLQGATGWLGQTCQVFVDCPWSFCCLARFRWFLHPDLLISLSTLRSPAPHSRPTLRLGPRRDGSRCRKETAFRLACDTAPNRVMDAS